MRLDASTRFTHQRLDAYWIAQEAAVACVRVTEDLPSGFADLRTQARRAALATVRHIAEGAARVSAADKRARFVIARGEVAEVHATLQTAALLGVIRQADFDHLATLCDRVAAMLTGLIRRNPVP